MARSDEDLVRDLCEVEYGLTGWEVDFVESIAKQVGERRELSEKQREKAESILERLNR